MTRLTDNAKSCIALYQRSEHDKDGWAKCSSATAKLMHELVPHDLLEFDGMCVRLSPEGLIVAKYL